MSKAHKKRVVVLGSTGSVGMQTLDVVRNMPEAYQVVGLSGYSRWQELGRQVAEFQPEAAAVGTEADVRCLAGMLNGRSVELLHGPEGLRRLAGWPSADIVVSAVSGGAGLPAAVETLRSGKTLALANKESLVMCGPLLKEMAVACGGTILPVDSEHSAVFQLLEGREVDEVSRIILTASGGPFYGRSRGELERVTPAQACQHPTWQMGSKISVDSATLMNKALEIVEARWLFDMPAEKIGVLLHPQCVIHCLVELVDGSILAHMGAPDMRLPIQYALSYPQRLPGVASRLNLGRLKGLELCEPDLEDFPALALGYRVARRGGTSGAVLSAADEVAVEAFLGGRIRFTDIVRLVETVLDHHEVDETPTLERVMAADRWAREETLRCLPLL